MCFINQKVSKPYIILLTHGKWGEELIKGTEMIVGDIENIFTFSLFPEQSVDNYMSNIEEKLKCLPGKIIILTDLLGGTTSNVALLLSSKYNCETLSGLDMSMLIAADELRIKHEGIELIDKIIERSINNCKNIKKLIK